MTDSRISFRLTLALAFTMMLGPFSLDTYLPAFPAMAADLGVDLAGISLSVSCYVFTMALSQLVGGALSDQLGRRTVLLVGLVIYLAAAVAVGLSGNLGFLLASRTVQAFGAGWVLVSVPALVRDRVAGQEAAKLFSMIGLIMIIAPGIAPSVGSAILGFASWRAIFFFLAAYGCLLIPLALRVVFTEMPARRGPRTSTGILQRYGDILRERRALPFILWQAAAFSVMMVFVTHASFIYQEHFGQSTARFALLFAANIVAMMGFNLLNRFLLTRFRSITVLRLATAAHALGAGLLLAVSLLDGSVSAFLPAMMLTLGSLGAIAPNIQANFLEFFPQSGGTAAAILGAAQFGLSGLASALSTQLPLTLPSLIGAMAVLASVPFSTMLLTLCSPGKARREDR